MSNFPRTLSDLLFFILSEFNRSPFLSRKLQTVSCSGVEIYSEPKISPNFFPKTDKCCARRANLWAKTVAERVNGKVNGSLIGMDCNFS